MEKINKTSILIIGILILVVIGLSVGLASASKQECEFIGGASMDQAVFN